MPSAPAGPNPAIIFDTLNAYQRSAALKAGIELGLFTQIARGNRTSEAIAKAVGAPLRATRIFCDYLTVQGLLIKDNGAYSPSPEAAIFLNQDSPAYLGGIVDFMLTPNLISPYLDLAKVIRDGRTTLPDEGTVSHDNPIWVNFARNMAALARPASMEMAELLAGTGPLEVLDIAAGHGLFGVAIAKKNPQAKITALDWPNVLDVATENATAAGVAERHTKKEGDAFSVEFGGPYDLVLVTNFFHHFNIPTCEDLMRKIHKALKPGGRCATLDFVPNEDRVSPPTPAAFGMMMLGSTAEGDVYTFAEYDRMFKSAGFASSEMHPLKMSPQQLIVSVKS